MKIEEDESAQHALLLAPIFLVKVRNRPIRRPLQYQQNTLPIGSNLDSTVCHTVEMEDKMHHPNILTTFRN
ncbi:MAG: hypothetical protein CSA32_05365 [Desulfobulbus propionicus]|nr:MAG: hypothetical protein CSA32_05365 [Desulfobulbus propionicus]